MACPEWDIAKWTRASSIASSLSSKNIRPSRCVATSKVAIAVLSAVLIDSSSRVEGWFGKSCCLFAEGGSLVQFDGGRGGFTQEVRQREGDGVYSAQQGGAVQKL
jgi:hypothetical protein